MGVCMFVEREKNSHTPGLCLFYMAIGSRQIALFYQHLFIWLAKIWIRHLSNTQSQDCIRHFLALVLRDVYHLYCYNFIYEPHVGQQQKNSVVQLIGYAFKNNDERCKLGISGRDRNDNLRISVLKHLRRNFTCWLDLALVIKTIATHKFHKILSSDICFHNKLRF